MAQLVFDPFFIWLESTALSVWVREGESILIFPMILAVHTIGLGLLVGVNAALDLRILGIAGEIPIMAFRRFVPIMWVGLWLNVISGALLLIAYPTKALTNPVFYLKLALIAAALLIFRRVRARTLSATPVREDARSLAWVSLVCWAGAITAGRLLAYTHTRLDASPPF